MGRLKAKVMERYLAVILSFVMIFVTMPIGTLQVKATGASGGNSSVIEQSRVSVYVSDGNATVSMNGTEVELSKGQEHAVAVDKGTEVPVEIMPEEGAYIKELTIGKELVEVAKGQKYVATIKADSNVFIGVKTMKEFTISASANVGGTVTLNSQKVSSLVVDEGTEVNVAVTAEDGYQISSVSIDGAAQDISASAVSFEKAVNITADTQIEATFVKVYTVTVKVDGNGTVETDPTGEGGVVTVKTGEEIIITAEPNEYYRVSMVEITGHKAITFEENDKAYDTTLTADKDYEVAITFAPNRYEIRAIEPENGTIKVSSELVEYGSDCEVTVTPDEGYSLSTLTVSGNDVVDYDEYEDGKVIFSITDIAAEKEIKATFIVKEKNYTGVEALFNVEDAVRISEMDYIYANGGNVTFATDKLGIQLYCGKQKLGDWKTNTIVIDETISISEIKLFYKAEKEKWPNWHTVEGVSQSNPLRIIFDETAADITVTPDEANENSFYNDSFSVKVKAEDKGDYSGIAQIEYFVTDEEIAKSVAYDDVNEEQKTVFDGNVTYTDISAAREETISVIVGEDTNNSDYVAVWVKVTDFAGNVETLRTENLLVNCTAPVLKSVEIDGTLDTEATTGYYNGTRTAKITIIDRASSFDEAKASEGIKITAKDVDGKDVLISRPTMISWTDGENKDTHIGTIVFDTDANYEWSISYTNKAGKEMITTDAVESGDNIYSFTVDKLAPTGGISFNVGGLWDRLLSKLTFGIWDNESITTVVEKNDSISPMYDVLYYKTDSETALTEVELEELFAAGEFVSAPYAVTTDEKVVIYARITDYAGNTLYISTDGAVVDTTKGVITLEEDAPNENGFYNKDVEVRISVTEIVEGKSAYSGIKSIDYKIVVDERYDSPTQSGNLYTFNKENPTYEELRAAWNSSDADGKVIIVDSKLNNSDKVVVVVTVVDNAGNEYSKDIALAINVDEVKTEIALDGTPYKEVDGRGYYSMEARKATITIKERASAFDASAATDGITVTAKDAKGTAVEDAYKVSAWHSEGDVHTATVTFIEDANYEWSFEYTNKAGNMLDVERNLSTGTTSTPFVFTLDDTNPQGAVTVNANVWDRLLSILTFGLYSNVKVDVEATAADATSPVIIEYYKTANVVAMTTEELDKVAFEEFKPFSVDPDEQFVVYLKITDYAGNYIYLNSDGYIVDKESSKITLTPSATNENGIYGINSVVSVDIAVEDAEPYSGIKTVEYWVENNGKETQRKVLYSFDYARDVAELNSNGGTLKITDWDSEAQDNTEPVVYEGIYPAQADLKQSWNGTVIIDKELNNSCNVVVYVKTVDNAGNEDTSSVSLDIDNTAPVIDVVFDNGNDNNGNGYFDEQRTATITITERAHHFDAEAATKGITITAVDAYEEAVTGAYQLSGWTAGNIAEDADAQTYTATLFFEKDANYEWSIAYTDKAGNTNVDVNTSVVAGNGESVAPFKFTVDTTAPYGTVKAVSTEGREEEWNALRAQDTLTFGFWTKGMFTISGTAFDDTSAPIASVEYYKAVATNSLDVVQLLTEAELDQIKDWAAFDGFEITNDERCVVYIKITDLAGNYKYISTNGLIVDHYAANVENIAPEVYITPVQQANELYNKDVTVSISVADPIVNGAYSGLKSVEYRVLNMGTVTQSGTLQSFGVGDPKQSELVRAWSGSIVVNSELNNSNDVTIIVSAVDNANNGSEAQTKIKIDVTAPTIDVSYDNNSADSEVFFKEDRVATITITERNFNPNDVQITINNSEEYIPGLSDWTKIAGSGNQDNTQWRAQIVYGTDGDYTFDVAYTDLASNPCLGANYGDNVAPREFTIDKSQPQISVSYDNDSSPDGNEEFFKETRTATVEIREHNFDITRVEWDIWYDGVKKDNPDVEWSHNGDVHTAVIAYVEDGVYKFGVTMLDRAGNENDTIDFTDSVSAEAFVIDTKAPVSTISGVENGKSYKGVVEPKVAFNDTNLKSYTVELYRTSLREKMVKVSGEEYKRNENLGEQDGFVNFVPFDEADVAYDGIYTLRVEITDKAGNVKTLDDVVFMVNRFGSVYEYGDYLMSLIKEGGQYIKSEGDGKPAITEDLVIMEYSPNALMDNELMVLITRDGQAVSADTGAISKRVDSNSATSGNENGWYQYEYRIPASLFTEDGIYKIAIASKYSTDDKEDVFETSSVPENTLDSNGNQVLDTMSFVVDTTPPQLQNVINLDKAIVDAQRVDVKYTIMDVGGLSSIEIILNGQVYETITDFGENPLKYSGDFPIMESSEAQTVQIRAWDIAGNSIDTETMEFGEGAGFVFNDRITVSTSALVRWYANKSLFWGSIAGVVALFGAGGSLVAVKQRKKKEKSN